MTYIWAVSFCLLTMFKRWFWVVNMCDAKLKACILKCFSYLKKKPYHKSVVTFVIKRFYALLFYRYYRKSWKQVLLKCHCVNISSSVQCISFVYMYHIYLVPGNNTKWGVTKDSPNVLILLFKMCRHIHGFPWTQIVQLR